MGRTISRRRRITAAILLLPLISTQFIHAQDQIWRSYFELEGRAGGLSQIGQGNLFVPIWQDDSSLVFADLRGHWSDVGASEGNWGLAYRRILDTDWILGAYGFYDLRHSQFNNNFDQATVGAELLNVDWGFRANGYIPDSNVKAAPGGPSGAFYSGGTIVIRSGGEAAYYGMDFEAERLAWHSQPCRESCHGRWLHKLDAEVWVSAGVFHFDNRHGGFEDITGPRLRTELRLYDLPKLGIDSRVVLSGQYEHDDVRGSVGTGMVTLRMPFGPGGGRNRGSMSPLDRRMVSPIVRDVDVVTQGGTFEEPTKFADTMQPIGQVTLIDANTADVPAMVAAAGNDSTVIINGEAGIINVADAVKLQQGQTLRGGGFGVIGCHSGTPALFGVRPTVHRTTLGRGGVFEIANDSTLRGITVTGVNDGPNDIETGVLIHNRANALIEDLYISDSFDYGVISTGASEFVMNNSTIDLTTEFALGLHIVNGQTTINNSSINVTAFNAGGLNYVVTQGNSTLLVDGSTITSENGSGLSFTNTRLLNSVTTGSLHGTVRNSIINGFLDNSILVIARPLTATTCLNFHDNTLNNGMGSIRLTQSGMSTLNVTQASAVDLAARNGISPGNVSTFGVINFNQPPCLTP